MLLIQVLSHDLDTPHSSPSTHTVLPSIARDSAFHQVDLRSVTPAAKNNELLATPTYLVYQAAIF